MLIQFCWNISRVWHGNSNAWCLLKDVSETGKGQDGPLYRHANTKLIYFWGKSSNTLLTLITLPIFWCSWAGRFSESFAGFLTTTEVPTLCGRCNSQTAINALMATFQQEKRKPILNLNFSCTCQFIWITYYACIFNCLYFPNKANIFINLTEHIIIFKKSVVKM